MRAADFLTLLKGNALAGNPPMWRADKILVFPAKAEGT